ncbi:MAG: asnC [Frankiales bacterium]|nr:asnC [Frankiales bacterium]
MNDPASRPAPRLDEVDRRIVAALQSAPRASGSQLAGVIGVSETTVLRRVQRLRDSGALIIVGAPDALRCGFGQPVFLYFQTQPGAAPALAAMLAERPDVRYVSLLTGRSDVMCELIAGDNRHLSQVLMYELPASGWIRASETAVVLKRFKTRDQWSGPLLGVASELAASAEPPVEEFHRPDPMDIRLMAELGQDGRRSYADLSHALGLSETAVARRIGVLTAANQLTFVAMVDPAALGFTFEAMLQLRVDLAALEAIALQVASLTAVRYVAATTGYSDLVVDAVFRDTAALYEFVSHTLGLIHGVRDVQLDVVLHSIKREYRYPLFGRDTATVGRST